MYTEHEIQKFSENVNNKIGVPPKYLRKISTSEVDGFQYVYSSPSSLCSKVLGSEREKKRSTTTIKSYLFSCTTKTKQFKL